MMRKFLPAIFLFFLLNAGVTAQGVGDPIAPENVAQVQQIARLGRGIISEIAYSPDGQQLAVAGSVGVWLYNMGDPQAEPAQLAVDLGVMSVAFSPDGRMLASGSVGGTVRIWGISP